ncbi:TetR/AcrR family transcriptional regulator [Lichenihabitans sp. Uapishka_5]|uniref:TetR/AcrR family transcriptional regulator n=1 Tax=Lichenihabitans sp. Uapishka_5 TaxID=3037302 RepID=UPI0029E81755|nr:TetR/AcrR family transcriptional regulator [Lichenihabitans sp. Uapishka_5]MDX7951182.1 TetR/AcrR family transcriptional regulator [Lichenihabitans sp. Uapishka_5]
MTILPPKPGDPNASQDVRDRVLQVAARLVAEGGRAALTTRAVVAAAGIQQPTLYRLFGDKTGLLEAVAEAGLASYVADKASAEPDPDPLLDFRMGWDSHVGFGLAHPALFAIIWGNPDPARVSPAANAGRVALRRKVQALAVAGLLRVSETKAERLTHATCTGVVLALLDMPDDDRDIELASITREAVIQAITFAAPATATPGPAGAAIALRASLAHTTGLTPGERLLLAELLDRISEQA